MACEATIGVLDLHVAIEQASEFQRTEVHRPYTVIDLFEADVLADANGGDVYPAALPADPAVGTHTVGRANPLGQPELLEQAREHRLGVVHRGRVQPLAAQQVAAESIGHRQWKAI